MLDFMENSNTKVKSKEEKELEALLLQKQELLNTQTKQYLETLFKENSSKPVKLYNVQILNSQDFRNSFLLSQFKPLNQKKYILSTFFKSIDEVTNNLSKSSGLENLSIELNSQANDDSIIFQPVFKLQPIKKFFAKTGSNIGNGEGDGYINFQWRNIFGGGENLSFDATTGTRTSSSYLLNFNSPILNNTNYKFSNSIFVNSRSMEWINSESHLRGMTTKINSNFDNNINFNVQVDNIWRILHNVKSKSWDIISQSGDNFKSSISSSINYDDRDNIHLPKTGKFLQFGVEYNGLSSLLDKFVKTLLEGQFTIPLHQHHHFIVTSKTGFLYSPKSSYILDRFFIGGPNDVRSFMMNGLGPKQYGDSIGGDIFLNGGVSLVSSIPYYRESNFKFHQFINWGSLKLFDRANVKKSLLDHEFSVGYGMGILYNHPMARFELNFVVPLSSHQKDSIRKGLQYGIGVSFL